MMRRLGAVAALLVVAAIPTRAEDSEKSKGDFSYTPKNGLVFKTADEDFKLHMSSRVQVRFTQEEPEVGDSTGSFRVRRFKLKLDGHAYRYWKYKLQVNFASGSVEGDNDALLEDAYLQYTKNSWVQPFMGQGKAWFSRQALNSSGKLQFVDRSIVTSGGNAEIARQIGAGIVGHDKKKRFEYNLGVYNGDGTNSINQKKNQNDAFLVVGRAVWTPFGAYKPEESALDRPESSKLALGIKGRTDTITEEFDPDDGGPIDPGPVDLDVSAAGFEFAYKIHGFATVGEWFRVNADEPIVDGMGMVTTAERELDAWYLQASYLFRNNVEVAGRYAEIDPETPNSMLTEAGVAISYYIVKHSYKFQADFRDLTSDADPMEDTQEARFQFQFVF
jgi:hypothetical protein